MNFRVVFCKARDPLHFISPMINSIQDVDASHVAIEFIHPCGLRVFLDASSKTVRLIPEELFTEKYEMTRIYNCNKALDYNDFAKFYIPLLGTKYSYMQIIGNLLMIIGVVNKNIRRNGAAKVVCNEVVEMFLNKFFRAKRLTNLEDFDLDATDMHLKELGFF